MGTSERKRTLTVGLFVLVGLIILVAGILVLGTQQNKFSKNLVITTFFKDVKGLKVGNNVWFSGVKVGIIKEITFQSIDDVKVVMHIEEKSSEFIREDVNAKLGSDGLIGNAIVSLVGGTDRVPPIKDGDVIKSVNGTDTEAMFATLQANNENLVEITKNFAILSKQMVEGKGTVGALLTDSTIAESLKGSVGSLNKVMSDANKATANLAALMTKLNGNQGLIHDLTTDTEVFASLRQSAAQLQGVTQTATALMSNLNETSKRLNDKDNAVGVLLNDPATAVEIKAILNNLNASTAKLDENMKALQSNFLFRGYFKKQLKEQEKALKAVN
ncbi:MlaD family protein [Sphingobacterium psychroaquaticum]|uniref:Phospholipid/cholesterol/gamma-HCH transport system substrate-binding protein n=1 Tax=Sphingobacterium psychroaquaticum TaxID=561061 RepID=A0A1X7IZH5_9SPHI|nr:MlaD family protein [Sphingobacterium psychroaquaticum]QBQ40246.1 MCE family protein [Sphingobacterium psychroaquaticum]SMG20604.1 phospholipid/cholesterol/gamma-HCH transport system substrate-binding protein [Sphingobacterium psychroaquaticum]